MKKNNKIIISLISISTLLVGCPAKDKNSYMEKELSILVPTGAPSIAFLNQLNNPNFNTNTVPNNIVTEMLKGAPDIAVVDLIGGLTAIEKKNAPYKLASIITFGNFYIYSTGNDENNLMESEDNIVGFGQSNTPDILFNHLYPNIGVDTYLPGVSDVAPIAASGKINNENVDYCIIAEPVLYNILKNEKAPTYGKGSKFSNFQEVWKQKHGEDTSILGAAVYVKNETYTEYSQQIDHFLNGISLEIETLISDPQKAVTILNNYGSIEEQAQKIGINSTVLNGVLTDNSINLGYINSKDSNFNNIIEEYLFVVKPEIGNSDYYL